MRLSQPVLVAVALLGASSCAPEGPYPSLAPRPIEKAMADSEELPAPTKVADDSGLPAKIQPLMTKTRHGETEYQAELPEAREAASRAGSSGSDSWVRAQQAVSRLEAARATTTSALADLDSLALAQARAGPISPADRERIDAAIREAQALADRQQAEIVRLQGQIGN
jgi:Meckel syndrome type 1 protein